MRVAYERKRVVSPVRTIPRVNLERRRTGTGKKTDDGFREFFFEYLNIIGKIYSRVLAGRTIGRRTRLYRTRRKKKDSVTSV